ncbi:MAG: hypothetical protein H6722_29830 [Sandaracinus sp.]|nr:hypothetical protein [Sandaracinus sp.]
MASLDDVIAKAPRIGLFEVERPEIVAWSFGKHSRSGTLGTHAAMFDVNPWRRQAWMRHKRNDETMLYVHVAEAHLRELPEPVRGR